MKIRLQTYDPAWPERFKLLSGQLREALSVPGLQLEHIGSTGVPGLIAKPVIDILAGVPEGISMENLPEKVLELSEWLYIPYWENELPFRRFFIRQEIALARRLPGSRVISDDSVLELPYAGRSAHLHMVSMDHPFFEEHIRFRDILCEKDSVRKAYAELKTGLAHQEWGSGADYAAAKTDFIRSVLDGAD